MRKRHVPIVTVDRRKIKILLAERDWTQLQLSDATGILNSMLSMVLTGQRPCSRRLARRIARALKVPLARILADTETDMAAAA